MRDDPEIAVRRDEGRVAILGIGELHLEIALDRRGRLGPPADADEARRVRALVPLSELFGYANDLRARTHGRGSFEMRFVEYGPVSPRRRDDDRTASVGASRRPAPNPRLSSIALPEPDPDDFDGR